MCMPRKLATMPREGVSFPSVDHLRVHRRPVEGSWKAYRGCLASEQAIAGGLMCMPKIFATAASLGVVGPTDVDHQARQRPTPLTSSTFLTTV